MRVNVRLRVGEFDAQSPSASESTEVDQLSKEDELAAAAFQKTAEQILRRAPNSRASAFTNELPMTGQIPLPRKRPIARWIRLRRRCDVQCVRADIKLNVATHKSGILISTGPAPGLIPRRFLRALAHYRIVTMNYDGKLSRHRRFVCDNDDEQLCGPTIW